jgi:pimeloyl-ACP methyl ester carboxylesterase
LKTVKALRAIGPPPHTPERSLEATWGEVTHWVPPECSVAYFEALQAPLKKLVWFEYSGHEPFADEPEKFNAVMLQEVLPVVAAQFAASH